MWSHARVLDTHLSSGKEWRPGSETNAPNVLTSPGWKSWKTHKVTSGPKKHIYWEQWRWCSGSGAPSLNEGYSKNICFYFGAVIDIYPHAARALLCPAQNWTLQQDDVTLQHTQSTRMHKLQECSFFILSYLNNFSVCVSLIVTNLFKHTHTWKYLITIIGLNEILSVSKNFFPQVFFCPFQPFFFVCVCLKLDGYPVFSCFQQFSGDFVDSERTEFKLWATGSDGRTPSRRNSKAETLLQSFLLVRPLSVTSAITSLTADAHKHAHEHWTKQNDIRKRRNNRNQTEGSSCWRSHENTRRRPARPLLPELVFIDVYATLGEMGRLQELQQICWGMMSV